MAHIVVSGAAGFIGSHTVDRLLAGGHVVTGVDNFRSGRRANLAGALGHERFDLVEADVAEPGRLARVVGAKPTDALIHLAALVSVPESIQDPDLNHALNVRATHFAAEAARLHRVPRLVFASSAAVYGNAGDLPLRESAEKSPISPYGAAKLASEALLFGHGAAFGIIVTCLRYFNVFGPRQDPSSPYTGVISAFQRQYRAGQPVTIFGDGQQTRDFISVHDVARANVLAATQATISGPCNICTGHATSLLDLVAVFRRRYLQGAAPVFEAPRAGDVLHSRGAPDQAAAKLGFRAEVAVADGLAELIRAG